MANQSKKSKKSSNRLKDQTAVYAVNTAQSFVDVLDGTPVAVSLVMDRIKLEQVLYQARSLPMEEKKELVELLSKDLSGDLLTDEELAKIAEERWAAYKRGECKLIPAEKVYRDIEKMFFSKDKCN